MAAPVASLVMPLRRQKDEWLEQSVRSALAQTVPVELVVVTAADTPASNLTTLSRLGGDAGERMRVYNRPRAGFAVALNEGFRQARCERVGLLFSDDWLADDAFELALARQADIVSGGKEIWAQENGDTFVRVLEWVGNTDQFERLATIEQKARYVSHFLLLARDRVMAVGGVDESLGDLSGVDDYDMIWSMLEDGASVAFTDRASYGVRDHNQGRLTLRAPEEQLISLHRILDKHGVDPSARAELVAQHAAWYGRTISEVLREADRGPTRGP